MSHNCAIGIVVGGSPPNNWDQVPEFRPENYIPPHVEEHFKKLLESKSNKYSTERMGTLRSDIEVYKKLYISQSKFLLKEFVTALNKRECECIMHIMKGEHASHEQVYLDMALTDFLSN